MLKVFQDVQTAIKALLVKLANLPCTSKEFGVWLLTLILKLADGEPKMYFERLVFNPFLLDV